MFVLIELFLSFYDLRAELPYARQTCLSGWPDGPVRLARRVRPYQFSSHSDPFGVVPLSYSLAVMLYAFATGQTLDHP